MFSCFSQKDFQENLESWQDKYNLGTDKISENIGCKESKDFFQCNLTLLCNQKKQMSKKVSNTY